MEYALHLTRLFPDMMYIHQDSGLVNVAYFRFNMDDRKGVFIRVSFDFYINIQII